MTRHWTEQTAQRLCLVTGVLILLCAAVIGGRVAAYKNLWRPPELGPWAYVVLWVFLAAGLLFGMDRGIPRDGQWSRRLYWLRRALLAAVFATIAVTVYVG